MFLSSIEAANGAECTGLDEVCCPGRFVLEPPPPRIETCEGLKDQGIEGYR